MSLEEYFIPKECRSRRVRAAGQQGPALARAAPISPPPAPQPQCPHSRTRSRFRKLTPGITVLERHALRRTRSPWSAAPDVSYATESKNPSRYKFPPGTEHLTPTSRCSMWELKTQIQPQGQGQPMQLLRLGNQTGSVFAKCMFYLNWVPIRVRRNKAPRVCYCWGLFSFLHPTDRLISTFFLLSYYWRKEPGKGLSKWEHEKLMRDELSILSCAQL